ncbi:hypothetical protein QBC33DRAFT_185116 [Phialemonium atrogriseum]|uniref:Uncharacterized protein n=1 Tax=Phialemonium atrogriseum TaxID=1093897 RepID=A0AAJ0BXA4_9PEZI|nr:uncharacterized protein QBC33DRAFT_185116 [Phialemonium atrogriseum]KAK1764824.1 hypothetical protein QBC33DRAFT_185116 [Phialemonium atrogriseum]
MAYKIFRRKWRVKRPIWFLVVMELAALVPLLVLFGIQRPDLYRTRFWNIGFDMKMNSNPNMILYAYANHRPLPTIPFVWSQTLTDFNVAISIISLFTLLTKMIMFIMKVWFPIIGLLQSFAMVGLYTASVYGQAGPDYADSRYPSPSPWYIRLSCDVAKPYNATKQCMMAKGTFAVTIFMLSVYLGNLGLAIWSMLPNKQQAEGDDDDEASSSGSPITDKQWEMQPVTPRTGLPFTPRTQAFHTLDRRLPLRHQ